MAKKHPYMYTSISKTRSKASKLAEFLNILEHIEAKHGNINITVNGKPFKMEHLELQHDIIFHKTLNITTSDWNKNGDYD